MHWNKVQKYVRENYWIDVANHFREDGGGEGQREGVAEDAEDKAEHELRDGHAGDVHTPLVTTAGVWVGTDNTQSSHIATWTTPSDY